METDRKKKKLCKSRKNQMVDGVLAGIAEYLEVDPTLVRIVYCVLLVLYNPVALIILYILLAIVMPRCEAEEEEQKEWKITFQENRAVALVLIIVSLLLIFRGGIFRNVSITDPLAGILLLGIAIYMLVRGK